MTMKIHRYMYHKLSTHTASKNIKIKQLSSITLAWFTIDINVITLWFGYNE